MISLTRAQIEVIVQITGQTQDVVIEHSITPGSIKVTELLQSGQTFKYELSDSGRKKHIV